MFYNYNVIIKMSALYRRIALPKCKQVIKVCLDSAIISG